MHNAKLPIMIISTLVEEKESARPPGGDFSNNWIVKSYFERLSLTKITLKYNFIH